MKPNIIESNLRAKLREVQPDESLLTFLEHGKGGDAGVADCLFLIHPHWVPVELKLGNSIVKELRPTQRRWHKLALMRFMQTFGLSIDKDGTIRLYAIYLDSMKLDERLLQTYNEKRPISWDDMVREIEYYGLPYE